MSDTPRTSDLLGKLIEEDGGLDEMNAPFVWVRLTKTLERELNAAKQERADFGTLVDKLERELNAAKAEIQAMRAAIEEAETSLTDIAEYWDQDENEVAMSDACWHAIGTAQKAIAKLKPFIK